MLLNEKQAKSIYPTKESQSMQDIVKHRNTTLTKDEEESEKRRRNAKLQK